MLRRLLVAMMTFGIAAGAGSNTARSECDEPFFQTGYFIEDGKRVFDEEKFQVFALRLDTPVYSASTGPNQPKAATTGFAQRLLVSDPGLGTERVRVRKPSDEELGWIDRRDLLCRTLPLPDPTTGLLRRMVIQTETAVQGQVVPKIAYHSPQGQCEGGQQSCPKLSRFQWYFVYAEEGGHVLLSEAANLGGRDVQLVGWLPEADGISWNTAVALRPAENLKKSGNTEGHVCAYPSIDAINDPKLCRPVLGGARWFTIDTRLPLLRDHGKAHEVAISSAATTGSFDDALSHAAVDALKRVDVFFVIDGTKSMGSVIDAIKGRPGFPGVVDQIRTRMKGKISQGGALRFGYRIYRDSTRGGPTGVESDGLALSDKCEPNEDEFTRAFASVQAQDPPGDSDYAENSFGGLIQASRDFSSCPDHLKLIVVIGDNGYDPAAQKARGHRAYDVDSVVQRYVRGRRLNTQPIVIFLQTPSDAPTGAHAEHYNKSYADFRNQGLQILKGVYSQMAAGSGAASDPQDFFFTLPSMQADTAVIDRIIARIDTLLQPDVIGKLATRLRSGEALVDAITAMQKGDRTNVPVLYWNVVADALCKRLGSQCDKQVLEGVFRAYIPHTSDLVSEVLLSQRQLEDWRELLGKFKMFWSQLRSGDKSRSYLVNVLAESIGSVLKIDIDDSGKTIGEFAQLSGGLPHGADSKLMAYAPAELRDESVIQMCEIQHLVNYASKKADIIQIVLDGDKLALFTEEKLPVSACPTLSAKGKAVPHMPGPPRPRALNAPDANTNYSFTFRKGNERYFWIPVNYLP